MSFQLDPIHQVSTGGKGADLGFNLPPLADRIARPKLLGGNSGDIQYSFYKICGFRTKSATDSDGSRPPNMIEVGHPFR